MGQLRFLLFSLLLGFASCGTLSLNSTTTITTPKTTPESTVTAGTTTTTITTPKTTPEATVTAGTTTKTTSIPSSTTTTSTTTTKPLLITTTTITTTANASSPAPWFVEEEKDFADDLEQSMAPIEPKLPTSGCKAAAFSSVFSSSSVSSASSSPGIIPTNGIISGAFPASLPRREKIFVRIPSDQCPPEIMRKAITELNNLRGCQKKAAMTHSDSLAAEASQWASETASKGVVYKPNAGSIGQYATSTAAPYALFSLDLSDFEVLAKWKGSGNNYLPWYTGSGGSPPRHFTNDEWGRVREFGVGCAAYRYKQAKAMFWTVVFFRKA